MQIPPGQNVALAVADAIIYYISVRYLIGFNSRQLHNPALSVTDNTRRSFAFPLRPLSYKKRFHKGPKRI